nr:carcinoembryonic antigen-related cell adhesion molecule 8-like [Paramormyrops kingsleyae]
MMERITFTAFFLSLFAACRSLQVTIVLKPDVGTVGDSVQFLVSTDSHNGFLFISWTVNGSTILTFDGTNIITAPVYNERINFDITTGSLELKNLTLHDSGTYQLQIVAAGEPQVQEVILNVLVGPDTVAVAVSPPGPIFTSGTSLTLSCSAQSRPPAQFQ